MVFDAGSGRSGPAVEGRADARTGSRVVRPPEAVAFAGWAVAFAMGTLIHAWQGTQANPASGLVGVLTAVAAVFVLLRPTAPGRLILLLAALLAEIVLDLPDLVNHLVVIGVLGLTLIPWWLVLRVRHPQVAQDPAQMYVRVGPYLRLAFILTFAFAALAKLNSGFLDQVGTCAVWILESIPFVTVPAALHGPAIYGTIALEIAIPTLLLFRRTRPFAILLGFGFHLVSAFAGHASFSGFAWSFYLLFLPPAVIVAAAARARAAVPGTVVGMWVRRQARSSSTLVAVAVFWAAGTVAIALLPGGLQWRAHWMTAAVVCTAWMGVCGWLLWTLRREWLPASGDPAAGRGALRVTQPLMLLGVGLLVLTALMPYLGLKTRAALTMFSNVRTEPGEWNHLVLPESMRVFDWQDGVVQFLGSNEPALDAAVADYSRSGRLPLLEARRIVEHYPAADVRYTIDGVERLASPVSADTTIGVPLSPEQEWLGAMRPYTDAPRCQH